MKLNEQGTARARLRMLRVWLTPEQYRQVDDALGAVEAPTRSELRQRLAVAFRAGCIAFTEAPSRRSET